MGPVAGLSAPRRPRTTRQRLLVPPARAVRFRPRALGAVLRGDRRADRRRAATGRPHRTPGRRTQEDRMTTDIAPQTEQERALAEREDAASALAHILATGDLSQLSNEQRVAHYLSLCRKLGLLAESRPFDWLQ